MYFDCKYFLSFDSFSASPLVAKAVTNLSDQFNPISPGGGGADSAPLGDFP